MQSIIKTANQILELIDEGERYHKYKSLISSRIARIFHEYQEGLHTFAEYKKKLEELSKGKTKQDLEEYYSAYLYSIMKKIELLLSKIFYEIYEDKSWQKLKISENKEETIELKAPKPLIKAERQPIFPVSVYTKIKNFVKQEKRRGIFTGKYVLTVIRKIFGLKEETFLGEKISVPKEVLKLRKKTPEFIEISTPSAIAEEAARIKKVLARREEIEVYKPSFIGSLANITIRKTSFYLIDNFPEFFRYLYNALRLANIRMLSNTYVNVMVFMSLFTIFAAFPIFMIFLSKLGNPASIAILKSIILSIIAGLISFFAFYSYPYAKIRQRARDIKTNLPFAINHMAAVAASGVPPVKMFKLIAESKEYGEISIEIEKIVEYVELFGYDFLTALKSVSATTPSEPLKEFFEGVISNIESGSDLKIYMTEKSKEALLEYELERQKFTETISTYSDIYTGILIAAPLFFVAALSLVSILGGVIGGIPIDTLIIIGTYIVIPLLNIIFIIFLQLTQPEV
ncbi:MAG: type II secretion system F family protein [Candidatus Woesearchaeota archaeon]